jgi:glycerol-3-phosphate dehydrogenase
MKTKFYTPLRVDCVADIIYVLDNNGKVLCYIIKDTFKNQIDLALLIASSPEMADALVNAHNTIEYLRQYVCNQGLSAESDCDESLSEIKSILEKATGQTIEELTNQEGL